MTMPITLLSTFVWEIGHYVIGRDNRELFPTHGVARRLAKCDSSSPSHVSSNDNRRHSLYPWTEMVVGG
jgi:hypothetical protein